MTFILITGREITGVIQNLSSEGEIGMTRIPLVGDWVLWIILILIILLFLVLRAMGKLKRKELKENEKDLEVKKYSEILKKPIKEALMQGYSEESIKQSLIEKDWPSNLIEKCLKEVKSSLLEI